MRVVAVFDPLLLHEFELPKDAGVQGHEDDASIVAIVYRPAFGNILAVGQAPAHDAAPIAQPAVEAESVSWVKAPDVRADGAAGAVQIVSVGKGRVLVFVGNDRRIGTVRRELQ